MERYRQLETDEEQHIAIALHRYNTFTPATDSIKHNFKTTSYKVRGFGHLMAVGAKVSEAAGAAISFGAMLLTGRALSTLFALLLVIIVYRIGRVSGLPPPAAGVQLCSLREPTLTPLTTTTPYWP